MRLEADDEVDSPLILAREVIYQDGPPEIASSTAWAECVLFGGEGQHSSLFIDSMYTKTEEWAYEEEWRVVSVKRPHETGTYGDYNFNKKELAAVYFGSECNPDDQSQILTILAEEYPQAETYKAYLDLETTRFKFHELQTDKDSE